MKRKNNFSSFSSISYFALICESSWSIWAKPEYGWLVMSYINSEAYIGYVVDEEIMYIMLLN